MVRTSDVVITMGCGDACPIYPGKRYEDWELEDPAGKDLETVRRIRDEIEARWTPCCRASAPPERDRAADQEADDGRADRELGAVLANLALDVGDLHPAAAERVHRAGELVALLDDVLRICSAERVPGGGGVQRPSPRVSRVRPMRVRMRVPPPPSNACLISLASSIAISGVGGAPA